MTESVWTWCQDCFVGPADLRLGNSTNQSSFKSHDAIDAPVKQNQDRRSPLSSRRN
jgi:hypothetical protein